MQKQYTGGYETRLWEAQARDVFVNAMLNNRRETESTLANV